MKIGENRLRKLELITLKDRRRPVSNV